MSSSSSALQGAFRCTNGKENLRKRSEGPAQKNKTHPPAEAQVTDDAFTDCSHLLSAAVGCDGPLRGSSQRRPVVVKVAGRIHLVLRRADDESVSVL